MFDQASDGSQVRISGYIQGLTPDALRGLHVQYVRHSVFQCRGMIWSFSELGNLTGGCLSAGAHYNPEGKNHAAPTDWPNRHVGDLGNVQSNGSGVATLDFTDPGISLTGPKSIIGYVYLDAELIVMGRSH